MDATSEGGGVPCRDSPHNHVSVPHYRNDPEYLVEVLLVITVGWQPVLGRGSGRGWRRWWWLGFQPSPWSWLGASPQHSRVKSCHQSYHGVVCVNPGFSRCKHRCRNRHVVSPPARDLSPPLRSTSTVPLREVKWDLAPLKSQYFPRGRTYTGCQGGCFASTGGPAIYTGGSGPRVP